METGQLRIAITDTLRPLRPLRTLSTQLVQFLYYLTQSIYIFFDSGPAGAEADDAMGGVCRTTEAELGGFS